MAEALAVIGSVASILQLADTAFQLSKKLYSTSAALSTATEDIKSLSRDLEIFGQSLTLLSRLLEDGHSEGGKSRYSDAIYLLTSKIIEDCADIYVKIDRLMEKLKKKSLKNKFKWLYKERGIASLMTRLGQLKATLMTVLMSLQVDMQLSMITPSRSAILKLVDAPLQQETLQRLKSAQAKIQRTEALKMNQTEPLSKSTEPVEVDPEKIHHSSIKTTNSFIEKRSQVTAPPPVNMGIFQMNAIMPQTQTRAVKVVDDDSASIMSFESFATAVSVQPPENGMISKAKSPMQEDARTSAWRNEMARTAENHLGMSVEMAKSWAWSLPLPELETSGLHSQIPVPADVAPKSTFPMHSLPPIAPDFSSASPSRDAHLPDKKKSRSSGWTIEPISEYGIPTSVAETRKVALVEEAFQTIEFEQLPRKKKRASDGASIVDSSQSTPEYLKNTHLNGTQLSYEGENHSTDVGFTDFLQQTQGTEESNDFEFPKYATASVEDRLPKQDISFTPLGSPAVTPTEPYINVPGAYLNPLSTPKLQAQNYAQHTSSVHMKDQLNEISDLMKENVVPTPIIEGEEEEELFNAMSNLKITPISSRPPGAFTVDKGTGYVPDNNDAVPGDDDQLLNRETESTQIDLKRQIAEIEAADAEHEKKEAEYVERRQVIIEKSKFKKSRFATTENDLKLREQKREMERLEDEKEARRNAAKAEARISATGKTRTTPSTLAPKLISMSLAGGLASTPTSDDSMGLPSKSFVAEKRTKLASLNLTPLLTESSFRDRIAAFDKAATPPVSFKPSGRGGSRSSSFTTKPLAAPPLSKNTYITPPPGQLQESSEFVAEESKNQKQEEQAGSVNSEKPPKPISLKERVASLQNQQTEQARRQVSHKEKSTSLSSIFEISSIQKTHLWWQAYGRLQTSDSNLVIMFERHLQANSHWPEAPTSDSSWAHIINISLSIIGNHIQLYSVSEAKPVFDVLQVIRSSLGFETAAIAWMTVCAAVTKSQYAQTSMTDLIEIVSIIARYAVMENLYLSAPGLTVRRDYEEVLTSMATLTLRHLMRISISKVALSEAEREKSMVYIREVEEECRAFAVVLETNEVKKSLDRLIEDTPEESDEESSDEVEDSYSPPVVPAT